MKSATLDSRFLELTQASISYDSLANIEKSSPALLGRISVYSFLGYKKPSILLSEVIEGMEMVCEV